MEMKEDSKLRTIDLSAPFTRHGACVTCHQEMRPCEHLLACAYKCKETHGFFLPGVSSSDDFIKAVHHKTYLAQSVREAIAGKEVRLADSEMLVPDDATKPTVAYSAAERNKGKQQKRIPSRGENAASAAAATAPPPPPPPLLSQGNPPRPPPTVHGATRVALPAQAESAPKRITRSMLSTERSTQR